MKPMNTECVKIVALVACVIVAFSLLVWLPRQDQINNEYKYNSYVTPYINEALYLDKALKLNLESEIGKKTQNMKDSINTQTPRNQKAAIYAQD